MLRIRLGTSWKQDPALRAAAARGEDALLDAVMRGVDAVAIEVDGVDLSAGRAEGPVIGSLEALGHGMVALLSGAPRAQVSFGEGELELVIARHGGSALLTIVSLRRPARVVAREVEVELSELVAATRDALGGLALELRTLHASAVDTMARSLAALGERLAHPEALLPPPGDPATGSAPVAGDHAAEPPYCGFELDTDDSLVRSYRGPGADLGSLLVPGRVVLRAQDRAVIADVRGPPFLLLRDLVAFAAEVASAARTRSPVRVALPGPSRQEVIELTADLASATVSRGRGEAFACPPLLLARAICDAAVDLTDRLVARNPRQERNGWVASLRGDAEERGAQLDELRDGDLLSPHAGPVRRRRARPLPRTPLGPGTMRRLVFRHAWTLDVGAPVRGALSRWENLLVAAGRGAVVGVDARTGEERWRRPGVGSAWARGGLFVVEEGRLVAVDPTSGHARGAVDLTLLPASAVREVQRIAGGLALAAVPGAVAAVDPGTGRVVWTFAPPAALDVRASPFGPLVLVASDTGFLYGVDAASGQHRWRLHLPGRLAAPPIAFGGACVVVCDTDLGGSLVSLDPATGHRRFEVPLDVTPTGAPVHFAGLLGVPASVAADAVVTAVDPAGQLAWEEAAALGAGAVAIAALPVLLLAKTADGACTALDRDGEPIWSRPAISGHLAPANPAPVVARGVALVPSERVEAIDPQSGALLGEVPVQDPVELLCGASLDVWAIDAEGVVTAARLETHLSVVRSGA